VATRPEPTIYGNCDSWSFIVGKKPGTYSPSKTKTSSLQPCNKILIHNLYTNQPSKFWTTCGWSVDHYLSTIWLPVSWI